MVIAQAHERSTARFAYHDPTIAHPFRITFSSVREGILSPILNKFVHAFFVSSEVSV
jgi:hypothetical protein